MSVCKECGKPINNDDIGAHRKFVNRFDTSFLCLDCLAKRISTTRELLENKIEHLKKIGCSMF